ncbi:uncharacterized protein BDV14DRAFT_180001 [Aspergillus stella-maris]|uniref:uncharacterized protein n=1 Tax=Aspergillus stella-maris TaxID=1810926 RepID=UPI003CCE228F
MSPAFWHPIRAGHLIRSFRRNQVAHSLLRPQYRLPCLTPVSRAKFSSPGMSLHNSRHIHQSQSHRNVAAQASRAIPQKPESESVGAPQANAAEDTSCANSSGPLYR